MTKISVQYANHLRCRAQHLQSRSTLDTDAPTDNLGKGERFSPTDLLATSLGTCMITLMGIISKKNGIPLGKVDAQIEKIMSSTPRKVAEIKIEISVEDLGLDPKQKAALESAARKCPVALSLSDDLKQTVTFKYYS